MRSSGKTTAIYKVITWCWHYTFFAACFAMLVFFATGCKKQLKTYKRTQLLMGTLVEITVVGDDEKTAYAAATKGFKEIKRLEALFSNYIATSEISRLNSVAGVNKVQASPDTVELLERGLEITRLTNGAFNMAVGRAVTAWDIPEKNNIPEPELLTKIRKSADISKLEIDKDAGTIYLKDKDISIDTGGIGKGFAADKAVEILKREGISSGIVAVAGDIRTFGKRPDGKPWKLGVKAPRGNGLVMEMDLSDKAISTSGDYERFFIKDDKRYHHILDPATMEPAMTSQSVSVISEHSYKSDGLATGLFVMGYEKGLPLVEKLSGVDAIFIDENGLKHTSSGIKPGHS